eukprot:m.50604 g.50604  ORF g.50604 m.50604 type:complete len:69 (+) comp13439_c0_seq1:838-1044(+)
MNLSLSHGLLDNRWKVVCDGNDEGASRMEMELREWKWCCCKSGDGRRAAMRMSRDARKKTNTINRDAV